MCTPKNALWLHSVILARAISWKKKPGRKLCQRFRGLKAFWEWTKNKTKLASTSPRLPVRNRASDAEVNLALNVNEKNIKQFSGVRLVVNVNSNVNGKALCITCEKSQTNPSRILQPFPRKWTMQGKLIIWQSCLTAKAKAGHKDDYIHWQFVDTNTLPTVLVTSSGFSSLAAAEEACHWATVLRGEPSQRQSYLLQETTSVQQAKWHNVLAAVQQYKIFATIIKHKVKYPAQAKHSWFIMKEYTHCTLMSSSKFFKKIATTLQ